MDRLRETELIRRLPPGRVLLSAREAVRALA